jgi:hypothetical protein
MIVPMYSPRSPSEWLEFLASVGDHADVARVEANARAFAQRPTDFGPRLFLCNLLDEGLPAEFRLAAFFAIAADERGRDGQ